LTKGNIAVLSYSPGGNTCHKVGPTGIWGQRWWFILSPLWSLRYL